MNLPEQELLIGNNQNLSHSKEPEGMAGHEELENKSSQEDCTKTGRTIQNR
jgi:hypothetical protein